MTQTEIIDRIKQLKKEKNAIILAHYYTRPEVQDIADYLGDSLGLSQMAGTTEADIIVFCGYISWRKQHPSSLPTRKY